MTRSTILCTVVVVLAGMTTAEAEDKVSVGAAADLFSKYVWRGQNVVDDWVLQPSVSLGYKGFTGSVWGNMDLTGETVGGGQFNEVDFSLDYTNQVPGLDVLNYSLGIIHYDFVNTDFPATTEVYGGLTASVPLSPTVRWYYDLDEIEGSYIQLSLGHTIEKIRRWRDDCYCDLQLGASLGYGTAGYNEGYFGVDEGALNDLTLTASLPICFGKLTVRPSVGYSIMIDDDIRAATGESDNFWGGIGLAYSF